METKKTTTKIWLIGRRIYFNKIEKTFVIDSCHPKYQIYPDELSQMFLIALKYRLLEFHLVTNQESDEIWGGKFNFRVFDEKMFKDWLEEE